MPEDREALFNYILEKTIEREAFSAVKNKKLNLDIKAGMLKFKDEMIAADNDEKLFNVLMKISNARKDRHLRVSLVKGGLKIENTRQSFTRQFGSRLIMALLECICFLSVILQRISVIMLALPFLKLEINCWRSRISRSNNISKK